MASPPRSTPIWAWAWPALLLLLLIEPAAAFYLPGSYPHKHPVNDPLFVKVNSLTSIDTEILFSYYSLPFCRPSDGINDSAENLGELLMGDRIESSPYRFKTLVNESDLFLCQTPPLSNHDFALFAKRIDWFNKNHTDPRKALDEGKELGMPDPTVS